MRTALITTTINQPHVLHLYRKFGPDVQFFVAGDLKTPDPDSDAPWTYIHPQDQDVWKCSMPIGWNCIQRRNIALLEAVKWGADIIVSIDDDNIPISQSYFRQFSNLFYWEGVEVDYRNRRTPVTKIPASFSGTMAANGSWFDVGLLLNPVAPHRGVPQPHVGPPHISYTVDAKIGVAAGLCLGDPDINAVYRMTVGPTVNSVSELLRAGIVVDTSSCKTVFNSQNTAIIRDLAPAFFMIPGIGRYDDIFASLICQRVMRERSLHVHFGPPYVFQQRNPHNLINDLKAETWGMENILAFTDVLDKVHLPQDLSVLEMVRRIWSYEPVQKLLPEQSWKAALAFLDDMESVL